MIEVHRFPVIPTAMGRLYELLAVGRLGRQCKVLAALFRGKIAYWNFKKNIETIGHRTLRTQGAKYRKRQPRLFVSLDVTNWERSNITWREWEKNDVRWYQVDQFKITRSGDICTEACLEIAKGTIHLLTLVISIFATFKTQVKTIYSMAFLDGQL